MHEAYIHTSETRPATNFTRVNKQYYEVHFYTPLGRSRGRSRTFACLSAQRLFATAVMRNTVEAEEPSTT
jgi:hypothetical protein